MLNNMYKTIIKDIGLRYKNIIIDFGIRHGGYKNIIKDVGIRCGYAGLGCISVLSTIIILDMPSPRYKYDTILPFVLCGSVCMISCIPLLFFKKPNYVIISQLMKVGYITHGSGFLYLLI